MRHHRFCYFAGVNGQNVRYLFVCFCVFVCVVVVVKLVQLVAWRDVVCVCVCACVGVYGVRCTGVL
jgi:hypothetical protein